MLATSPTIHLDLDALPGTPACASADNPVYVVAQVDSSAVTCRKCMAHLKRARASRQIPAVRPSRFVSVTRLAVPGEIAAVRKPAGKIIPFPGVVRRATP